MNIRPPGWIVLLLLACWHPVALKAQLKLGANPASISKSSILELESSRQGLLLPRVPDTAVTTLAAAPDGTIIYFTPANSILVRKEGAWRQMTDASTPGWLLNGNTLDGTVTLGTVNNFALPFITNNQERMRIAANGAVGIGITDPGNPLVVKDTLEIRQTNTASQLSQILFTNVSGTGAGDFRIGSDGQDVYWQGGGGRSLQMGSFWGMILGGDSQTSAFPAFVNGTSGGTGVLVQSQRTASIPLAVQGIASQTANLTEWRNSAAAILNAITAAGSMGIGNAAPSTKLHITTGTANDGGLRMENLTSSSAITTGSAVGALGMDATGKVVRAQRPVIYSGGAGANGAAGGTATADAVTKVWIANVNNTATGTQTINFPTNVTFTNILSIQAIAVGGTGTADAPVVSITSNTLSSMVIRVLESSTVVLANEALTLHTNTGTRIYIRVEGN